ncbi:MAG: sialidase family protein [bacterium]
MNFWNNPENNALKMLLAVAVILFAGFFVYKHFHTNSLAGKGLVLGTGTTTWTKQLASGPHTIYGMAGSSDGNKLVFVEMGGYAYTSIDAGVSWTARTSSTIQDWRSVASSADGTKLIAAAHGAYLYTSADSGATWVAQTGSGLRDWSSVASSADGTKLVATDVRTGGYIYTSTDSGVHWTQRISVPGSNWWSVTSSADGLRLAAVDNRPTGVVHMSTDGGVSWTDHAIPGATLISYKAITYTSDGVKIAVGDISNKLYTSVYPFTTWTERDPLGAPWAALAYSGDGSKLLAATSDGKLFLSTNDGADWTEEASAGIHTWMAGSLTASFNGSNLAAAADYVWTNTSGTIDGTSPVVTTLPATGITVLGGVVLNGRLNLMGSAPTVTVGFNYGTTTAYGTTTTVPAPRTTVGVFTNPYTITGLLCGTTYHVQAFAVSSAGTSYGADVPFTTVACAVHTVVAPTVVTNPASSISRTGATLNGNLTSLGGATTTTVGFQLGTTTTYGTTMTVTAPRTSAGTFTNPTTISTLIPNTLYHYRAFATNSAGTVYGADVTFTTLR